MYRYISHESCSQFDSLPLTSLTSRYVESLGVPYFYETEEIFTWAAEKKPSSICSFCARMKRGKLYACARREGYNVLALGQHLDDIAESFLMGAFMNGELRAMKACYDAGARVARESKSGAEEGTARDGAALEPIRVVRPLIYAREAEMRKFAAGAGLPVITENCPACFEAPKERRRVKKVLAQQESQFHAVSVARRSAENACSAVSCRLIGIPLGRVQPPPRGQ